MKIHDPDNEIPEEGTRYRHDKREKSEVANLEPHETDLTSIVPQYTVEVLDPHARTSGTNVEMYVKVEVIDTKDPEHLEEGYKFLVSLDVLQSDIYTKLE